MAAHSVWLSWCGWDANWVEVFFLLKLWWRGRRFPTPLGGRVEESACELRGGPQKTLQVLPQEGGESRKAKKTARHAR